MNQNTVKKILSYAAAVIALITAAAAAGTVSIPKGVIGWLGVAAGVLGILGASPIGRVKGIGRKETRYLEPEFPKDDAVPADDRETPRSMPILPLLLFTGALAFGVAAVSCYHGDPPWPSDPTQPELRMQDAGRDVARP